MQQANLDRMRLIGRHEEVSVIERMLAEGARLLTICGPPGVGKTALARSIAARAMIRARFIDLTETHDQAGLATAIATATGAGPLSGRDGVVTQLGRALAAQGELLMVLDNFEQLAPLAWTALAPLSDVCPDMRVLVTSRERLGLPIEQVFELTPLALPDGTRPAEESPAVALFVERATSARPQRRPAPEETSAVVEIVRQLDGLPLAIELAAARMSLLSAPQLLALLSRHLDVLARPSRGAAHHSTLRGAIDSSWKLLEPWERSALSQCAVFRGGFTLEAAEAVIDLSACHGAPWIVDVLQALRERSLLRADPSPEAPGQLRFNLYLSIREYAAEKLGAQDSAATEERHAAYYVDAARRALARLPDDSQTTMRWLAAEQDNLEIVFARAAARSTATSTAATRAMVFLALQPVRLSSGSIGAFLEMAREAVSAAEAPGVDRRLLARVLLAQAQAQAVRGDVLAGISTANRALQMARDLGEDVLAARCEIARGQMLQFRGHLRSAEAAFAVAAATFTTASEPACAEEVAMRQILLQLDAGDLDQAWRGLANLPLFTRAPEPMGELARAYGRAMLEHESGNHSEAAEAYRRGVELARRHGDRRLAAFVEATWGGLLLEQDDAAAALARLTPALRELTAFGDQRAVAAFLAYRGAAFARQLKLDLAAEDFERSSALCSASDSPVLAGVCDLFAGQLDLARAAVAPDLMQAAAPWSAAWRRFEYARTPLDGTFTEDPACLTRSWDGRLARRLLARALGARADDKDGPVLLADLRAGALHLPGRRRTIDLGRRITLQRVFMRLLTARVRSPGSAVLATELVEAGWPGELMMPSAAANRLHVALAALRSLGLRHMLLHRDGGHLIDPAVALRFVPLVAKAI